MPNDNKAEKKKKKDVKDSTAKLSTDDDGIIRETITVDVPTNTLKVEANKGKPPEKQERDENDTVEVIVKQPASEGAPRTTTITTGFNLPESSPRPSTQTSPGPKAGGKTTAKEGKTKKDNAPKASGPLKKGEVVNSVHGGTKGTLKGIFKGSESSAIKGVKSSTKGGGTKDGTKNPTEKSFRKHPGGLPKIADKGNSILELAKLSNKESKKDNSKGNGNKQMKNEKGTMETTKRGITVNRPVGTITPLKKALPEKKILSNMSAKCRKLTKIRADTNPKSVNSVAQANHPKQIKGSVGKGNKARRAHARLSLPSKNKTKNASTKPKLIRCTEKRNKQSVKNRKPGTALARLSFPTKRAKVHPCGKRKSGKLSQENNKTTNKPPLNKVSVQTKNIKYKSKKKKKKLPLCKDSLGSKMKPKIKTHPTIAGKIKSPTTGNPPTLGVSHLNHQVKKTGCRKKIATSSASSVSHKGSAKKKNHTGVIKIGGKVYHDISDSESLNTESLKSYSSSTNKKQGKETNPNKKRINSTEATRSNNQGQIGVAKEEAVKGATKKRKSSEDARPKSSFVTYVTVLMIYAFSATLFPFACTKDPKHLYWPAFMLLLSGIVSVLLRTQY